jgi:peptidoglycan/LPS O-acetylase OafA/YrhL
MSTEPPQPGRSTQPSTPSIAILSHLRWLAALAVAVSHIRQNILVDYKDVPHPSALIKALCAVTAYGREGVIVFFVLSGFLVGGKAVQLYQSPKIDQEWSRFLVDRVSRIFVVLLPALGLCLIIFAILYGIAANAPFMTSPGWGWAIAHPIGGDYSWLRWLNAAVLLNGLTAKTLCIDAPLWSLSFEWFYYMAALAFVLAVRRIFTPSAFLLIGYAIALAVLGLFLNRSMLELGLVWMFGVAAKVVFDRQILTVPALRWIGLVAVCAALAIHKDLPFSDYSLGVLVAFMIAHSGWSSWRWAEKTGDKLASFSYSLYLIHFPISVLALGCLYKIYGIQIKLPMNAKGLAIAGATLVIAVVAARGFAFCTEDNTKLFRNFLLRLRQRRPREGAAMSAAGD